MESLNMSKLNLSGVNNELAKETARKSDTSEGRIDLQFEEEDFHCEYSEDIWNNLLEQEAEKPTIHLQSPQLEFRGALVQQLRNAVKKLQLSTSTLHVAVALLDLFMDAHQLRADRLTDVAFACLSLAAKSEEKFSQAPKLKTLSKISGVQFSASTFRQLEWMVGKHVRWRLLMPTAVTFASLLAEFVVTDSDLTTRHPKFVRKFRRDGRKLLDAYLDLSLSDARLKTVESVEVGCACVACARAELGLCAWPPWLAERARKPHDHVAPIATLLHKMMQVLRSRESTEVDIDQGYGSARTSPNLTPCNSPKYSISPASSTCSTTSRHYSNADGTSAYRNKAIDIDRQKNQKDIENSILDMDDSSLDSNPTQINMFNHSIPGTFRSNSIADNGTNSYINRVSENVGNNDNVSNSSMFSKPNTSNVASRHNLTALTVSVPQNNVTIPQNTVPVHQTYASMPDKPVQIPQNSVNTIQVPQTAVEASQNTVYIPQNSVNTIQLPKAVVETTQNTAYIPQNTSQATQNTFYMSQNAVHASQNIVYRPQNTIQAPQNTIYRPQNAIQITQNTIYRPQNQVYRPQNTVSMTQTSIPVPDTYISVPQGSVLITQTVPTDARYHTIRRNDFNDFKYSRSRKMLEASMEVLDCTKIVGSSMAVKRSVSGLDKGLDKKRYRITQITQGV